MITEILVSLLGEGVDVWRPVRAEHVSGNLYRIAEQPYDRSSESWQFEPGDRVVCELVKLSDRTNLVAISLAAT